MPSCVSMRRSESNRVVTGEVRGPCCGTHCILSSLCFSPPSCIGPWRIQIPVLCHTLKPWCQPTHPPGASPPSPRELIKSFLLTNSVVSLRRILENKASSSHTQNEVFPMRYLSCSYKWSPGGHLLGLQCACSCLSPQVIHTWLSQPLGLHSRNRRIREDILGRVESFKKVLMKNKNNFNNCVLMNIHFKKKQAFKSS